MKACIVTVYNSENCGSYWQAAALQEYLTSCGCEVSFLRRNMKGASHTFPSLCKRIARGIKHGSFGRASGALKQYRMFDREIKVFPITEECGEEFDLCVLGSDTIWNMDQPYFVRERKDYWGARSHAKKTISYAASVANTGKEKIGRYPDAIECLNRLDAVSVRDLYTQSVIRELTDHPVELVCDPTLLQDKSFYIGKCPGKKTGRILFVYYFSEMPQELQAEVRRFAKEQGLQIVVMGSSMKGDVQEFIFSPSKFIEYYNAAEFVVTNTFHGTIFSIIFEKQAVFNSTGKQKVRDLLERFGVTGQDYADAENREGIFRTDGIDYQKARALAEEFRNESKAFLNRAITGGNNHVI